MVNWTTTISHRRQVIHTDEQQISNSIITVAWLKASLFDFSDQCVKFPMWQVCLLVAIRNTAVSGGCLVCFWNWLIYLIHSCPLKSKAGPVMQNLHVSETDLSISWSKNRLTRHPNRSSIKLHCCICWNREGESLTPLTVPRFFNSKGSRQHGQDLW